MPDVALEDGSMSKAEDLNDLAKQGRLPADIKAGAVPVSERAKQQADDEGRLVTVKQMLGGALQRALTPRANRKVMTTGHWRLDLDTGGFRPGMVWVFGADTSWGKSADLLMVADENIKLGFRVLIVSFEDPVDMYANRLMIRRSGFGQASKRVNTYRFDNGLMRKDEIERVTDVAHAGEDCPVYFNAIGKPVEWTCKQVRRIVQSEGIDLIAFDYLQSADHEKPQKDRRLQLNYITRVMTDTAKELGKAGIIYSQITPPEDGKAVPGKYSVRDSKDVSNGAEVIAIGFEPVTNIVNKEGRVLAEAGAKVIHLAKNKPGPGKKGEFYTMDWDKDHGCFDVLEDQQARYDYLHDIADVTVPEWEGAA
jgi:replicative DNA helicase